jgi:hypothetical protein
MKKFLCLSVACCALASCSVFSTQSFTCDTAPLTNESGGNETVSCASPDFLITCDSKTVSIVEDVISCKSADGKQYKISNGKAQKDKSCLGRLGEGGAYESDTKKCGCDYPYFLKDNKCENRTKVCAAKYGLHGIANQYGECSCEGGFVLKNGACFSVDDICKAQFGAGAKRFEYDDTKCGCDIGYQWNEKRDQCVCADNYHLEDGACVVSPFCGVGKYDLDSKKCVCAKGQIARNGICQIPSPYECGVEGTLNTDTGNCECNHGYYMKNNKCMLIPYCGDGNFNTKTDACDCIEGATMTNGICNKPFN